MSQLEDNRELTELLQSEGNWFSEKTIKSASYGSENPVAAKSEFGTGYRQWSSPDGTRFYPTSKTCPRISPGVYDINVCSTRGLYFEKIPIITRNLIRFPQTNIDRVVGEIQKFWEREDIFREFHLTHKRGIILWGPAGSGKTCAIQLIMNDVVERQGIVVRFGHPHIFTEGMRVMREIEPTTPVVVLMEDIDSTIQMYNESDVLNILDGVNQIEKAVYLATTNYPERLGPRIINRPSRFDRRFKIGYPDPESREIYLNHLIGPTKKPDDLGINIGRWVEDTDGFSFAHIKELFVGVVILADEYSECLATLTSMKETRLSSDDDFQRKMGFGQSLQKRAQEYGG